VILVKSIRVSGFRSLVDATIAGAGNLHALVGKNSSGKSNFLRALNLFFNNEIEAGRPFNFARDVFDRPKRRQKKRLEIAIDFELGPSFHFRKQQAYLAALGTRFRITRTWELDPRRNVLPRYTASVDGSAIPNSEALAPQFLALITFRYIPNRSVPARILQAESQTLASSIFRRMKDQAAAGKLMQQLTDAAARMLRSATAALEATGSPMTQPSVATRALSEMLSMSGFQARGHHGGVVQDEDWGAGHQAFFLYQVLHALDTDYSRYFGWRQATIWAVEEPESALHRELETRLAARLRDWAHAKDSRLQVFVSTHSSVFSMASDSGSWLELRDAGTTVRSVTIPELVRSAEQEGVSGWTHPILAHPWNTVVLVEGEIDAAVLSHVAGLSARDHLRFLPLPRLDESEAAGGKDSIASYLKRHQRLTANRPPEAPLLVLLDWEVSEDDLRKARSAYGSGGQDRVLRMDSSVCDPRMTGDFAGIERFYPARIVHEAQIAGEIVVGVGNDGNYSVSKAQLSTAKGKLRSRLLATTSPQELRPLSRAIDAVEACILRSRKAQRDLFADEGA